MILSNTCPAHIFCVNCIVSACRAPDIVTCIVSACRAPNIAPDIVTCIVSACRAPNIAPDIVTCIVSACRAPNIAPNIVTCIVSACRAPDIVTGIVSVCRAPNIAPYIVNCIASAALLISFQAMIVFIFLVLKNSNCIVLILTCYTYSLFVYKQTHNLAPYVNLKSMKHGELQYLYRHKRSYSFKTFTERTCKLV